MNVIEVKNVTKTYKLYDNEKDILKEIIFGGKRHKDYTALKNVSFKVKKGETYGILGGNGSGKSTILNIINGTTYPTSGSVNVKGTISLLNVGAGIVAGYTGIENIYYKCQLMGLKKEEVNEKLDSIIKFSELGEFINHKVSKYSSGMRSKLGFAIAIHIEPDILIVDEALAVGDSRFAKKCHNKMNDLKKKGITILYVSHSHTSVTNFCTRACWINKGRFIGEGDPKKISAIYEKFMNDTINLKEAKKLVKEIK